MDSTLHRLFATDVYEASFTVEPDFGIFNAALVQAALDLMQEDKAGRAWAAIHQYGGYTSYASKVKLFEKPVFLDLKGRIEAHVAQYADLLMFDLGARRLSAKQMWVNVLQPGRSHNGHIHPRSVISGTVYLRTPPGSGVLQLEDPRAALMMAAPQKRWGAPRDRQTFVPMTPQEGTLFLWESWLRHEVLPSTGAGERISVSFNCL